MLGLSSIGRGKKIYGFRGPIMGNNFINSIFLINMDLISTYVFSFGMTIISSCLTCASGSRSVIDFTPDSISYTTLLYS